MAQKKKNAAWADCCEDWGGYMAAKKAKLEEQFQEAAKSEFSTTSSLFSGIAIFVNGYTNPNADELKRIMMAHGGIYHHYLRPQSTTHMIASNLPYSKIVAYRKAQNPLPLCKPEWIKDSLKEGKLLDHRKYLLYSQCTKTQPAIFAQFSKQAKSPAETQTSNCSNSTISNRTTNFESQITSVEKKNELKLQAVSNPEVSSIISNCTKNPKFLTEFYNNSRLHHIATMGAMFKDYINDLRDKNDGKFPGLDALRNQFNARRCKAGPSNRVDDSDSDDELFNNNQYYSTVNPTASSSMEKNRIIMHIDMDCFFVSVGLRNQPELRGFPIAVAHAKGNKQSTSNDPNEYGSMSEVASCSYEARKAGVKNGMLLGQALKLCPNLKTIRYDFDGYKEVSHTLYDTVASYTLDIEAVSCDEMYADCTKILQSTGLTPLDFAAVIRNEIKQKTGCPVSTGFGGNKLQARLATKKAKPNGQYYLKGDDVKFFIRTLNVGDLPGVGYSTSHKLNQMNVKTCADLEAISLYELQKEFGKKNGQQLHDMCRGIDNNKLNLEHVRKSISAEVNYGIRFENKEVAHEFLKKLSIEISDRLKKINSRGRCITLKVMFRAKEAPNEPLKFMGHGICDAFNKSKNLVAPTDDPVIITREVLALWNQLHQDPEDARGIGIQITKLECSKTKSSGSTLLKFIDRMKVQEKPLNESNYFTSSNVKETNNSESSDSNFQNSNRLESETNVNDKNTNISDENTNVNDKNSNSQNSNEITLSLENQLISEEMQFDCNNSNDLQRESINENNLYDRNSDSHEANDFIPNLEKQLIATSNNVQKDDELINLAVTEQQSKNSSQLKQTKQPDYFKQTKPFSANKTGKVKMPDIQEIDMKVLVELPEEIRNEILNEYRENNVNKAADNYRQKTSEDNVSNGNPPNSRNGLERDLSFSQIDPDFLAALPEEMRSEVKSYCDAQKKEKSAQTEVKRPNNVANKGWNMIKSDFLSKKPQKNTKLKPGKSKTVKGGVKKDTKMNPSTSKNKNTKEIEMINKAKMPRDEKNETEKKKDVPVSNRRTFHFDPSNGNSEHSEILSDLVNCLLDLSVSQVKQQIQQWIVNNSDVNDVDFLSLTTYLGTLPRKRRLEDLHILMKCLYRCIVKSKSCVWHETYKKMLKHVQTRMQLQYGYDLMIPPKVECDKCNITNI